MTSFLHEFYNSYLQCMLNKKTNSLNTCSLISNKPVSNDEPLYRIYNHPIKLNNIRISYDTIIQRVADIGISLTILCAYSFIPAGFVVYMVRERISQEKRLQYVLRRATVHLLVRLVRLGLRLLSHYYLTDHCGHRWLSLDRLHGQCQEFCCSNCSFGSVWLVFIAYVLCFVDFL